MRSAPPSIPFGDSTGQEVADRRFTGKPYDADLNAYVFPYRNYSVATSRWMSADPAGFPDGPNRHFYAPVPTMGLDPWGLAYVEAVDYTNWNNVFSTLENWVRDLIGWDSVAAAGHYLKIGGDFNESNHQFYSYSVDSAMGQYTFTTIPVSYVLNVSDVVRGIKILEDGTEIEVLTVTSQFRAYFGIEYGGVQFSFDVASDTITLQLEAES